MTLQMNRKSGLSCLDTRCQKGDEIDLKDRKKMRNKAVNIMWKKIQVASLDLDDGQYMNIHKPVLSAFITPFESSEGISTVIKVTEQDFDQYGILHFSNAVKPLSLNQWKGDEPALNQDTVEATVCNNKADERDLKLPTIELEINGTLSIKEEDIDGKLATHVEDMNGTSSVDREYINGQLATNIEDMNGTSAADLGDRNGKSATYREDINGTSAADVGDMNGQLATHVEDMNGTSSVDREYINGQLATNMEYMKGTSSANIENINGKLTTNIEDMNGTSAADVGDRNGKSTTYREDINGTSAADIGDMNGKLATNVEDMNETSSLDVENINGKSATNTEDMNGTSSRDIEYLNGILATNVEDMNGTSSVDISGKLAMKEKSSGDVEDINRKFATNIEDMNGTLADEVGDMNGKLATNIEDMKGTSAADVGDMNGKLATKIEDMNGTSAADVGDVNGTSSADIEYINEKSATNIEEMNGTSAAHGEMNGKLATSVEDMKGTSSTDIEYIYGKFSSKVELEKRFKKQDGNCKLVGSDFFNQLSGIIRLSAHRHQSGKYNEEIEQQQIFNLNCNSRVRFLSSSQHKQHGQLAGTAQASWSIRIVISILLIGVLFTHVHAEDGEINRKAVYWKVKMDAVRYGEDLLLGCIDVNKETNNNTCKWNRRLKTGESASEILTWDNYSYNYSKFRRVNTCDLLVFALTPEDTELYDYYCTINTTSSSVKSILDGNAVVIPSEKNIVILEYRIEVDSRCSQDLILTLKINGEVKEEVECKTVGQLSEINISYNFTKSDLGKPMALTAKKFNTTFLVYNGTVPSNYKAHVRTEDNTYSAIVGAVGGGIAVLVVAAVIACGWWCYKRKKKMKEQRSMDVPFKEHFLSEKKEEHGNNQRNVCSTESVATYRMM